jgi:flagellar hook-length control protein FliK
MTNNINPVITEPLNSAKTGLLSKAKASAEGENGLNTEESLVSEDSFQASMLKLSDNSAITEEPLVLSADGNVLPVSGDTAENTAENDHPVLLAGMNLKNKNSQLVTQPVANAETSLELDSNIKHGSITDGSIKLSSESNLLSSSIRQLLQAESKEQGQSTLTKTSSINVTKDNVVSRQAETPLIKTDNIDLTAQKGPLTTQLPGQLSLMPTQQQLPIAEIQSALLLQSTSSVVETSNTLLTTSLNPATSNPVASNPVTSNPATNNFSSMSLATMPQTEIAEAFGKPAWSQGMGKQILWMANQNISSAEIRLNPAHLGPIEVRLDISEDQINVALSSRHAVVREAMEMALPKLREMFDSNGMSLADTDISQQSFAQQREQNSANGRGNTINNNTGHSDFINQDEAVINQSQLSTAMVDYYI